MHVGGDVGGVAGAGRRAIGAEGLNGFLGAVIFEVVAGVSGAFGLCGGFRPGVRCWWEVVTESEVELAPPR